MEDTLSIDHTNTDAVVIDKFTLPEAQIKDIQTQLHKIEAFGNSLAYTTTFVTYKLSYTTNEASQMLAEYAREITNFNVDAVTSTNTKTDSYHTYCKSANGQVWIVPRSSIDMLSNVAFATHMEVYVNFNEHDKKDSWYILEFYYDLITFDEALKRKDALKAQQPANRRTL